MLDHKKQAELEDNAIKQTTGYKRTMNYIVGLLEDAKFQNEVLRFRKEYKLANGVITKNIYDKKASRILRQYTTLKY